MHIGDGSSGKIWGIGERLWQLKQILTADEIGDRGEAIYEERLRAQLEPGNVGRFLSIDIDSGEYELGDDRLENVHRLRDRFPDAIVYTLKIGYPAVAVIGGRLRPNSELAQAKTLS